MERIHIDGTTTTALDDYLEYRRIVGEDDGGIAFTSDQYEQYKRRMIPQRMRNRLYVSFGVPGSMDCKLVGPETQCFCSHRFKQHKTDFDVVPSERPLALPCRVDGCRCPTYRYVPMNGSQPVRCRCKHSTQDHSEAAGHPCRRCSFCPGFQSPHTCGCGKPCYTHRTLVETRAERESRGHPGGRDVPYAAMGGLTGFSSLAEGYLRLDHSGSGSSLSVLSHENPEPLQPLGFEKAYGFTAASSGQTGSSLSVLSHETPRPLQSLEFEKAFTAASSGQTDSGSSMKEPASELRRREEEDMAAFERRYRERIKAETMATRQQSFRSRAWQDNPKPSTNVQTTLG